MQVKAGDRVKFLNDVGGGVVIRLLDRQLVLVRNEEGFEIPVLRSELLPDTPAQAQMLGRGEPSPESSPQSKPQPAGSPTPPPCLKPSASPPPKPSTEDRARMHFPLLHPLRDDQLALILALSPVDPDDVQARGYEVFLINESPYDCYACLARECSGKSTTISAQRLRPYAARLAQTIPSDQLIKFGNLHLQALFFSAGSHNPIPPVDRDVALDLKFVQRPGAFTENRFLPFDLLPIEVFNSRAEALRRNVASTDLEKVKRTKETRPPSRTPEVKADEVILDLHFDSLYPASCHLPDGEKLELQIKAFEEAMRKALADRSVRRLIAIHGIGVGRLKREILGSVKRNWPECALQDASFAEYGYGATMIMLVRKS